MMIIFLHCAVRTNLLFSPVFTVFLVKLIIFVEIQQSKITFVSPPKTTLPPHEADYLKVTKENQMPQPALNKNSVSALSTGRHLKQYLEEYF